jgi:unsaturated rhamnogalacturonyl hydrolase
VKNGGVLVLMGNDSGNAELSNFNNLASKFGIRFNEDNFNMVKNNNFPEGEVSVPDGHVLFPSAKKLFIKELATLNVKFPAVAVLTKEGKNIFAVSSYGKGTVIAVGDPWIYNEYIDGRKLPGEYDNYQAATDLVKWLIAQSNGRKQKATAAR